MPLIIQRIGENEIAVAHTYRQNGDTLNDPEMTFRIDAVNGTLEPLTYQQDAIGLYQQVYPEPGRWIPKLRNDLNAFATLQADLETTREEASRPFPQDAELERMSARLSELNTELDNEEKAKDKEQAQDGGDAPARAAAGAERAYSREAAI